MQIEKIQSYITPKTTGYTAAAAIGLAVLSGATKNKTLRKSHKAFAYLASAFTAMHIGLIEYYNYKFKKASRD